MNIFDQIAQQNIYRHLDRQILENIQNQHQASHELMWQLSKCRQSFDLKTDIIRNKIKKVQNYLALQDELLTALQGKDGRLDMLIWINHAVVENPLLTQLIKGQSLALQNQMFKIIKKIFLFKEESALFDQYLDDVKFSNAYLEFLKQICSIAQQGQMLPERATLIHVDNMEQQFLLIFKRFKQKTDCFNFEILKMLQRMYVFEQKIRASFKQVIQFSPLQQKNGAQVRSKDKQQQSQQSEHQKIQKQKQCSKNQGNKHPISESQITFYNKGSLCISTPREQITPRKNLYTVQDEVEQYAINAIINSKRARQIFDRRSNHGSEHSRRVLQTYNDTYNQTMDHFYRQNMGSSFERRSLGPKSLSNMNKVTSVPSNYDRKTLFKNAV